MYYQPDIETMSREELSKLQLERMKWSLSQAYENVDFFKRSFDGAGVTPDDLESLEDLAKFPFIVKQDMRDAYPYDIRHYGPGHGGGPHRARPGELGGLLRPRHRHGGRL